MNTLAQFKDYATQPLIIDRFAQAWDTNTSNAKRIAYSVFLKVANTPDLIICTPESIITSSLRAASMRLSIDLDQAYLVPFKSQCTLITGYRGLYELAQRTREYRYINTTSIQAGKTILFDDFTGCPRFADDKNSKGGWQSTIQLHNGFGKTIYWTYEQIHEHAKKYSPAYNNPRMPWKTATAKMEMKTVFRSLILTYGVLSIYDKGMMLNEDNQEVDQSLPVTIPEPEHKRIDKDAFIAMVSNA